jgi:nucleotide-binding universal stress UspA family protein
MTQLRHILAATDMSENALMAVERGFIIASARQTHYTIMHAIELDPMASLSRILGDVQDGFTRKLKDNIRAELSQVIARLSEKFAVMPALALADGLPVAELPSYLESHEVDLILLGAHGNGFLHGASIGATASRLLRKSRHPVLVVKKSPREFISACWWPLIFPVLLKKPSNWFAPWRRRPS